MDKTAAYYQFDSAALTIYSAGLKIRKGTPESPGEQVFYADNEGNLCLREICLVDEEGKIAAKVIQGGIGLHAITLYDIAHENEYGLIYVDENSPRLIIGGGGYGLSHIGNNPAVDNGVEIGSGYKRPISATPTEPEKKQHSGITLTGDVVISNFADDYYRYPVIGDANYKTRLYLENDAIKFALFNPVTDAVVNTYTLIPDSVN